jgi:SnoaL-like domain
MFIQHLKKIITIILILFSSFTVKAQKINLDNLNKRITEIEDRIAIKNIVDTFSILADKKETQKQTLLFTENATVESFLNGQSTGLLKGRKQIGDAFANFLSLFETVYHINGQQTITLKNNKASAISYCLVTLIGNVNGKKTKTTFGIYYNDDFVKENNYWLIEKRVSNFIWQDVQEIK